MILKEPSQIDASLNLFPDRFTVTSDSSGAVLKVVRYRSVVSAVYQETRENQAQKSGGIGALKGALSKGGQLFGAGKHWLTIQTDSDTVVMRVGRSYKEIVPVFERLSGITVKQ